MEYILEQFGKKKAKKVYQQIENMLEKIASMPEMFPVSKKKLGLRKCVFSKQTSIYYRINDGYVEIISFRNNRRDPDKFKD